MCLRWQSQTRHQPPAAHQMKQNQTEMLWIGLKIATKNTEKQTRKSRQANNEAQQTREQQPTINSNVSEEKEMNI